MVITGLTRNQVIPNGTEGSNPSLSAKKQDIAKAVSCFCIFVVCEQAVIKAAECTVLRVGKVHLVSFIVLKSSRC